MRKSEKFRRQEQIKQKLVSEGSISPSDNILPGFDDKLYKLYTNGFLHLDFHAGQEETWKSAARFVLMLAGTQGGKTSFGVWWLYNEYLTQGAGDYFAVTTNFDLFKLKMLPELKTVFCDFLKIGRYWGGARLIEIRDPKTGLFLARRSDDAMYARIVLRSVNAPEGLESATAKAAWLDELGQDAWDITHWEAILRRLSIASGRALGTTTIYNSGWLKREWYDRWRHGDKDYDVIQFASAANPVFPDDEQDRAKKVLPDWRYKMQYLGIFAKPAGLIYHEFDEESMTCDPFDIPGHWNRAVGLDFGGSNTAKVFLFEDTDRSPSTWYLGYETLDGGISTFDHVLHFWDIYRKTGGIEGGSLLVSGGAPAETQFRLDWLSEGLNVLPPLIIDVEVGISNVIEFMKEGRFKIFNDCRGILDEISTYRRKLDNLNQPMDIIEDKNEFHRLDALRYIVSFIHTSMYKSGTM